MAAPTNYERLMAIKTAAGDERKPSMKYLGTFLPVVKKLADAREEFRKTIPEARETEKPAVEGELQTFMAAAEADPTRPLFAVTVSFRKEPIAYWRKEDGKMIPVFFTNSKAGALCYRVEGDMCGPTSKTWGHWFELPSWGPFRRVPEDGEIWYPHPVTFELIRV
jgi:hypothetical protein